MQVCLWLLNVMSGTIPVADPGEEPGPLLWDQTEAWDSCRTSSAEAPRAEKNIYLRLDPPFYMSGSGWPAPLLPPPPPPLSDPPLNTATATFRLNPHGKRDINLISPSQRFSAILLMLMLMQFYRLVVPSSTRCLASECSGLNSIRWSLLPYY